MNENLHYFTQITNFRFSSILGKLENYLWTYYKEDSYSGESLFNAVNITLESAPKLNLDLGLNDLNSRLKYFIHLCENSSEMAFPEEEHVGGTYEEFVRICAREIHNAPTATHRLVYFYYICAWYVMQLEIEEDFLNEMYLSGLAEAFEVLLPSIIAERMNSQFATLLKGVDLQGQPEYVADLISHMRKGFYIPNGYNLEVDLENGEKKTLQPGEYSGSNYTFEEVRSGAHPTWNLVKTGEVAPPTNDAMFVDDEPIKAPEPIKAKIVKYNGPVLQDFAQGLNFSRFDTENERHMDFDVMQSDVKYPDIIVVDSLKERMRVNSGMEMAKVLLGNHPDIDIQNTHFLVELQEDNTLMVGAYLDTPDGDDVFSFVRFLEDGDKVVENHSMSVSPLYQGKGIAKTIYANQERHWKNIGVEQVKLFANSDVGGYAWATLGYDFEEPEIEATYLKTVANKKLARIGDLDNNVMSKLSRQIDSAVTAEDFSRLGVPHTDSRVSDFGKYLLLGSAWHGVKQL